MSLVLKSTAQLGESVNTTTINLANYKFGLYGRVARKKALLKESHRRCGLQFATSNVGESTNMWKEGGHIMLWCLSFAEAHVQS